MQELIRRSISDSISLKQQLLADPEILQNIERAAIDAAAVFQSGGKILLCGNGGSAADAQHLAAEFVSRFRFDRPALPALALNCNASVLTSIGNDYDYDYIFQRQTEALGRRGDLLWCFTTTGHSQNIARALRQARQTGMHTVGFLGSGGGICLPETDLAFLIPSDDTPRIQEAHIMIGHVICDCIEQSLFGQTSKSI